MIRINYPILLHDTMTTHLVAAIYLLALLKSMRVIALIMDTY